MKAALQYLHEILTLLGDDRQKLPAIVVLFLMASLLDLVGLSLIGPYLTLLINSEKGTTGYLGHWEKYLDINWNWETKILMTGLGLVLIFFLKALGNLLIQYGIMKFSLRQEIRLRTYLMHTYQKMPYNMYLSRNSSEYIHSVQILAGSYGGVLFVFLKGGSDIIVASVIILILAYENIMMLSILLCILGVLATIYDKSFKKRLREYGEQNNKANHQILKSLHEGIEGLKEVRILQKEKYFYSRLEKGAKKAAGLAIKKNLINLVPGYLLEFLLVMFVAGTVSLNILLGVTPTEFIPVLGLFAIGALRLKPIVNSLLGSLLDLRYNRDNIRRLTKDLEKINEVKRELIEQFSESKVEIEFKELKLKQVNFTYQGMKEPTLQNINLKIEAGEMIGLIGKSGCGKTTLVDLILGLLKPESGTVEINGINLSMALGQWQKQVAYLPQQIFMIDEKLKNNVAIGEDDEIDVNLVEESLSKACLSEFVESLPDGVRTELGERGIRISGGQRQRVALARAFYHKCNVIVMDESTSALDTATEREIVTEIRKLKGQKTIIVIAHRLSTLQHCDKVYKLEKSGIVNVSKKKEILEELSIK